MARLVRQLSISVDQHKPSSSQRATAHTGRPQLISNPASPSPSPLISFPSDKENHESTLTSNGKAGGKLKAMPRKTPGSADVGSSQSSKRRKLGERNAPISQVAFQKELDEIENTAYYDPDQPMEERRITRKRYRDLSKNLADSRGEYLEPESTGLTDLINSANSLFEGVKQTSDATLDSRILSLAADLSARRATQIKFGDQTQGIDLDEFIGKCRSFMRKGPSDSEAALGGTSTQRRRRAQANDDEGSADEGDALNWEWLGRKACFPNNLRPPVPSFLLGPLSVQKKVRKQTQRRERLQKRDPRDAVRPEELKVQDIERVENANLTTLCRNIFHQLDDVLGKRIDKANEQATDDVSDEDRMKLLEENGITYHSELPLGLPLFETVVNPLSFGQSVENLFYISFLIRDGKMGIYTDDAGLPSLYLFVDPEPSDPKKPKVNPPRAKHQAVFHLDFETWEDIVRAFEIKQCIIPHRNSDAGIQISASGWYA